MTRPHVVITGFKPFLHVETNPSAVLIDSLSRDPDWARASGGEARFVLLDTVYAGMCDALAALLADSPDALILTGYSGEARGLKIETQATSHCHPEYADAAGWTPPPTAEPVGRYVNKAVDVTALVAAVREAGIAAEASDDAGAYVCNHAYYQALGLIEKMGVRTRAVFVHLPAIEGEAAPVGASGVMELDAMRRGGGGCGAGVAGGAVGLGGQFGTAQAVVYLVAIETAFRRLIDYLLMGRPTFRREIRSIA